VLADALCFTACDRLVPSGFLIIDDYGHWLHCKRAIDDYFDTQGWTPALMHSDYTGRWMQKPEKAPGLRAAVRGKTPLTGSRD